MTSLSSISFLVVLFVSIIEQISCHSYPSSTSHNADAREEQLEVLWVSSLVRNQRRHIQEDENRGRTVLTVLYLCVLGLCFVVPVFYYFRMHCEERNARRMRELEMAGISEALEQSEQNREESRAARRKYREERRARILQLFAPVRMILKEENFPHLRDQEGPSTSSTRSKEAVEASAAVIESSRPNSTRSQRSNSSEGSTTEPVADVEQGEICSDDVLTEAKVSLQKEETPDGEDPDHKENQQMTSQVDAVTAPYLDEESTVVEIPAPGLYLAPIAQMDDVKLRQVPNMCSICLCSYEIGSDIVWSSNSACEHAFHEDCIEQWLMKQREGPLCPCCRRDFILDPYDLEEDAATDEDAAVVALAMDLLPTPPGTTVATAAYEDDHQEQEEVDEENPNNSNSSSGV